MVVVAMGPRGRERSPVRREEVVAVLLALLSPAGEVCDAFCKCSEGSMRV